MCACILWDFCIRPRTMKPRPSKRSSERYATIPMPNQKKKCISWFMFINHPSNMNQMSIFSFAIVTNDRNKMIRIEIAHNSFSDCPFTNPTQKHTGSYIYIYIYEMAHFSFGCCHRHHHYCRWSVSNNGVLWRWTYTYIRFTSLVGHSNWMLLVKLLIIMLALNKYEPNV